MSTDITDKIDMVYLWCDGNDPEFIKRKNQYLDSRTNSANRVSGDVRFVDNEELRYSLRSLEMYAPWINHVYIITDRQVPYWLNTDYEKVTVVDHSEIMPEECIPCFNSNVIEYFLPYVPNLSEVFLYGNDDMFFCAPVQKEDFIVNGKIINRLIPLPKIWKLKKRLHNYMVKKKLKKKNGRPSPLANAADLLEEYYGYVDYYAIHHNIDVYLKSSFLNTLEKFKDRFKNTSNYRFRNMNCIHRIIFAMDSVYQGKGIIEIVPDFIGLRNSFTWLNRKDVFSYFGKEYHLNRIKNIMKNGRPKMFCLNAADKTNLEIKKAAKNFMESLFPKPSRFEKL